MNGQCITIYGGSGSSGSYYPSGSSVYPNPYSYTFPTEPSPNPTIYPVPVPPNSYPNPNLPNYNNYYNNPYVSPYSNGVVYGSTTMTYSNGAPFPAGSSSTYSYGSYPSSFSYPLGTSPYSNWNMYPSQVNTFNYPSIQRCTSGSCRANEACLNGLCQSTILGNACSTNSQCPSTHVCVGNYCRILACFTSSDCFGHKCLNGKCCH